MNNRRNLVITLVLLSFSTGISAGTPTDTYENYNHELMRFTGNIHQFNELYPQEKVYLEFDNTAYFQGEAIWFKAFVTHATTLKRAPSKVLYVDLLAPTGQLVEQQKLKIVGGQCDGAFVLMDLATAQSREKRGILEYPSGFYEIRAYTQNMLDFSPDAIFSRVIPVYTGPKRMGDFDHSQVEPQTDDIRTPVLRAKADEEDSKVNVSFYPEGGDLVAGLPCNIAFKATGADGFKLDGALVYNGGSDTAYTVHDGMGSFMTVPQGGETVHFITDDGRRTRFTLPQAVQSGYSMTVQPRSDSLMKVSITCTPDHASEHTAIVVTCRGDVVYYNEIDNAGNSTLDVDCSAWPIGVCRMTLYNKKGRILSSRSLFHNNSMFRSPAITVLTDSLSREPFSKEVLNLRLTDKNGNPFRDRFCLSVRDADDYGTGLTENIQTNLLMSSDLRGYIHDPAWYLAVNDDEHRNALNLLTLVQGWERYEWKYTTGQEVFTERHRIEDSLTINGWVLSYFKRQPVSDINVYVSLVPYEDKGSYGSFIYHTDTTGYFGCDQTDFYGKARMLIQLKSKKKNGKTKTEKSIRIKLERAEKPEPRPFLKQETDMSHNSQRKELPKSGLNDDGLPLVINKDIGILLDEVEVEEDRPFIEHDTFTSWDSQDDAEMELDMGEYTSDMRDYLLERGFEEHFNEDGQAYLSMKGYPVFYYIHNQEKQVSYKPFDFPMQIDMIDVKSILIYDEPMYGPVFVDYVPLFRNKWILYNKPYIDTKHYVIDIQVKEDYELFSYKDIRNLSRRQTTFSGFSRPVEFYGPQYPDGPILGEPDLRRTIYWNPNVITDSEGRARVEFYNNSFTEKYTISGAGLTPGGIPYTLKQNW